MGQDAISRQTLHRLPLYVNYLKSLPAEVGNISATQIAEGLGLHDVQVRKDLAAISSGGRPKVGYAREKLTGEIQAFLDSGAEQQVAVVGMGHLGRALTHYGGFREYGQRVTAVFDSDPLVVGSSYIDHVIRDVSLVPELCRRLEVDIGIITVPEGSAQQVCDLLVAGGVKAIWNFAPAYLSVPEGIVVQNENMAVSLAILSKQLPGAVQPEKGVVRP